MVLVRARRCGISLMNSNECFFLASGYFWTRIVTKSERQHTHTHTHTTKDTTRHDTTNDTTLSSCCWIEKGAGLTSGSQAPMMFNREATISSFCFPAGLSTILPSTSMLQPVDALVCVVPCVVCVCVVMVCRVRVCAWPMR